MPLTFQEQLLPASYAGVGFGVHSAFYESGRRGEVHSFPQRDEPFIEDLGRIPEEYEIVGFLVGDDALQRKRALMRVATTRSPSAPFKIGRLLRHPYLGDVRAFPLGLRIRETWDDGRVVRFTLRLVKTADVPQPTKVTSAEAGADEEAAALADSAGDVAESEIVTTGPQRIRDTFAAGLAKLGAKLQSLDVFGGEAQEVAILAGQIVALVNEANDLARAPATAVATVRAALDAILLSASQASKAFSAYENLFGFQVESAGGAGATGLAAAANATALEDLVHRIAAAGSVRAGVRRTYASRPDARNARDRALGLLDDLAESSSGEVSRAVSKLRVAAHKGIPPDGSKLPELRTVTLKAETPALVLAWRLYGDATRADEIQERNGVAHGGFLPALEPLEVLER